LPTGLMGTWDEFKYGIFEHVARQVYDDLRKHK
jgi:hypothetical protein